MGKVRSEEAQREKEMFELASRNLTDIHLITDAEEMGIWELVKRRKVIMELSAVDEIIHRVDPEALWDVNEDEDDEEWEDDDLTEEEMATELEQALEAHQASL